MNLYLFPPINEMISLLFFLKFKILFGKPRGEVMLGRSKTHCFALSRAIKVTYQCLKTHMGSDVEQLMNMWNFRIA